MNRLSISRTTVLVTLGVIAFVVALAFSIAPNRTVNIDDGDAFTGRWLVNGVDASGVEYSGTLTIDAEGSEYVLQWIITGGIREGTGTTGADTLEVVWQEAEGIGLPRSGAAVYVVTGGRLEGVTTIDGFAGKGMEEGFPP